MKKTPSGHTYSPNLAHFILFLLTYAFNFIHLLIWFYMQPKPAWKFRHCYVAEAGLEPLSSYLHPPLRMLGLQVCFSPNADTNETEVRDSHYLLIVLPGLNP